MRLSPLARVDVVRHPNVRRRKPSTAGKSGCRRCGSTGVVEPPAVESTGRRSFFQASRLTRRAAAVEKLLHRLEQRHPILLEHDDVRAFLEFDEAPPGAVRKSLSGGAR